MDQLVKITDGLLNVFNYAFVETAPYSFFIPKRDKYIAVNLPKKMYNCLACGKAVEVRYNQAGVVYFSKERFEKQRAMYEKRGLEFPSKQAIRDEEPFIYQEEGYCDACGHKVLDIEEIGQKIYNQCLILHRIDEDIINKAREVMSDAVKKWLETITEAAKLASFDLSSYTAMQDLLCAVILEDTGALQKCLDEYKAGARKQIEELNTLMNGAAEKWESYAVRPTSVYESMSDELYHEYTVVFPIKETVNQDFYVRKVMEKNRVQMFLDQKRIETVEDLIMEAGFLDIWVDWFVDHVTSLNK